MKTIIVIVLFLFTLTACEKDKLSELDKAKAKLVGVWIENGVNYNYPPLNFKDECNGACDTLIFTNDNKAKSCFSSTILSYDLLNVDTIMFMTSKSRSGHYFEFLPDDQMVIFNFNIHSSQHVVKNIRYIKIE